MDTKKYSQPGGDPGSHGGPDTQDATKLSVSSIELLLMRDMTQING